MAIHAGTTSTVPDWQRVASLSTTFAAHALALLVLALPLAAPLVREEPARIEASVISEPPPPPPLPPEPVPLPRAQPVRVPTPPPRVAPTPPSLPVAATPTPIASAPIPTIAAPIDIAPTSTPAAAGATRTLAYDGRLKLPYPTASVRQREQGTVVLNVLVDVDGHVQRIEVSRSSGHRRLDDAAREAVQRARFLPVLIDGNAQPAWGLVPIEFRLDRG
jgi:protein TonB